MQSKSRPREKLPEKQEESSRKREEIDSNVQTGSSSVCGSPSPGGCVDSSSGGKDSGSIGKKDGRGSSMSVADRIRERRSIRMGS